MKVINLILSFIIGSILILSSLGKLMSIPLFLADLNSYGFGMAIIYFSLVLITIEIVVGMGLLLNINTKLFSFISIVLFVFFTLIFAFGNIFKGVEDCGCFGAIEALKTPPYLSYIRNFILICLSTFLFIKSEKNTIKTPVWKAVLVTIASCISLTITAYGYVYGTGSILKESTLASSTPLNNYSTKAGMNAYFIFSPTCPHCIDAIENVKTYANNEKLKNFQALSINTNDSINLKFNEEFNLPFRISQIKLEDLKKITLKIPVFILVRNDTIVSVQEQNIMHFKTFSKLYPNIFK